MKAMLASIAHRGPDDEGVYTGEMVSLGNKRLSIIDLETGHQPQEFQDSRYAIVSNSEIYNYRELRRRLEGGGHRFVTKSDTEVLLHWFVEHGVSGLPALNGMFAFALWDRDERTLVLARDRLGIKPLYYCVVGDRLVFASEIKAILPWLEDRRPNFDAIFEFLTFQNILTDQTFFAGVHKLSPGHWLQWTPDGIRTGQFWDVSFPRDYRGGIEEAVEEYRATFAEAIDRHFVSDVPVGACLSSGIDSSSVATMAARRMASPIHTFTGAFTDADYYDERVGSRSVANSIGAIPHEVEIRPADYVETIEKVIWHLDEPTLGTGAFPQYMVSRMAADHVKVVLTGHGGDELFAGYQVNKVALIKEALQGNPLSLFQVLLRIRWDEWTRVAYYLLYPLLYPEVRHGLFIMTPEKERASLFAGDFLSRVASHDLFMGVDRLVRDKDYSPGEKLLVLYLKTYLPTLFIQEDKMGMAHSIEARMPICDNRLVDLALRLPFRLKLWGGRLKSVPREAMRPWLPRTLYRLPKRGFPTPFARWYRCDPVRSLMEDLLYSQKTAERGIFNTKRVRLLFERNLRSKTDTLADYALANRLYSMSMVELWFRLFMDGGSSNELALR